MFLLSQWHVYHNSDMGIHIGSTVPHIFFIHYYAALSQSPNRPPLVVAAGQGQLATVQQLIKDGVSTLEDCDEVHTNCVLAWNGHYMHICTYML